jgi:hypothetical protein
MQLISETAISMTKSFFLFFLLKLLFHLTLTSPPSVLRLWTSLSLDMFLVLVSEALQVVTREAMDASYWSTLPTCHTRQNQSRSCRYS